MQPTSPRVCRSIHQPFGHICIASPSGRNGRQDCSRYEFCDLGRRVSQSGCDLYVQCARLDEQPLC
eukprot:5701217-Amphidinium_carterae.1